MIINLFFSLIRVAIGTQDTLPHAPSKDEWMELYAMAKKQSLVGIVFAAIQRIADDNHDDDDNNHSASGMASEDLEPCEVMARYWNMPEMLYLKWMGMAAKIQQRNEIVDKQCVILGERLKAEGYSYVILKGQGIGQLYAEHLRGLRQPGDIDVWVLREAGESEKGHIERIVKYAKNINPESHFSGKHIDLSVFDNTEVELHAIPAKMNCPWHERNLKAWLQKQGNGDRGESNGFEVPTTDFNLVYLLLHCFDHLLFEGVGLRQVMDYFFLLIHEDGEKEEWTMVREVIKNLGLLKFASAMMYVLKEVFGMSEQYMICEPNEKEGRFFLKEIMTGGNFGKYGKDGVMEGHERGKVAFAIASMKHKLRFITHYPSEVLWTPYSMIAYYFWKRNINEYENKQICKM